MTGGFPFPLLWQRGLARPDLRSFIGYRSQVEVLQKEKAAALKGGQDAEAACTAAIRGKQEAKAVCAGMSDEVAKLQAAVKGHEANMLASV